MGKVSLQHSDMAPTDNSETSGGAKIRGGIRPLSGEQSMLSVISKLVTGLLQLVPQPAAGSWQGLVLARGSPHINQCRGGGMAMNFVHMMLLGRVD